MTVKDLIEKLKTMPQEATVEIEIVCPYCEFDRGTKSVATPIDEVYKGVENNVVIQGIDY